MVAVDTDEKGLMKADVLEELIKQDKEKVYFFYNSKGCVILTHCLL